MVNPGTHISGLAVRNLGYNEIKQLVVKKRQSLHCAFTSCKVIRLIFGTGVISF